MEFLYLRHPFPLEFLRGQASNIAREWAGVFALSGDSNVCPELHLEIPMMDVVMVALAVGFFAVSIAYVYACEQL